LFFNWPDHSYIENCDMNCAICWNHFLSIPTTRFVSGFLTPVSNKVGMEMQPAGNQRRFYTIRKNSLVGTPETTRVATLSPSFCEWLAGVIDGDGFLYVNKENYVGLEITMDRYDEPCLTTIKTKFGGSIKLRSGSNSYRYRTQSHIVMLNLTNAINGHIRNSVRIPQLKAVCNQLHIHFKDPIPLTRNSSWFAGFFDADGTITYSMKLNGKRMMPQLSIRVVNKAKKDVQFFQDAFGGSLFYDKGQNGYWHWSVQSRDDILSMVDYFKIHQPRSHKFKRILLVHDYFILRDLEAYEVNNPQYNAWRNFERKWAYGEKE
nr:orf318 [Monoblepharella sp. JEL15]AAO64972.1 orf318 [Monoblepharella sp. JEL15]